MSGKYGKLIKEAKKQDSLTIKEVDNNIEKVNEEIDNHNENNITPKEPEAILSVKLPISLRRHFAAEAKRQGLTLKEVVTSALIQKFGTPS